MINHISSVLKEKKFPILNKLIKIIPGFKTIYM